MFEKPSGDTTGHLTPAEGNTVLQRYGNTLLPHRYLTGRDAFEAGLDEITKHHTVQPDPNKSAALVDMGYAENYATVALQLSNNLLDLAADLIQRMKGRSTELQNTPGAPGRPHSLSLPGNDKHYEGLSFAASGSKATPGRNMSSLFSVDGSLNGTSNAVGDAASGVSGFIGASASADIEEVNPNPVCPICKEDSLLKADQMIPCRACSIQYHTTCFGARRIPFSLKTIKERQNRDKYIAKHYGSWRCESCTQNNVELKDDSNLVEAAVAGVGVGGEKGPTGAANGAGEALSSSGHPNQRQVPDNSISPLTKTKHEQVAILLGLLSSSGITVDQLMSWGEDKQREALIAATMQHNTRASHSTGEGTELHPAGNGEHGLDSTPTRSNTVFGHIAASAAASVPSQSQRDAMYQSLASEKLKAAAGMNVGAGGLSNGASAGGGAGPSTSAAVGGASAPAKPSEAAPAADPRAAMMALLAKRAGNSDGAAAAAPAAQTAAPVTAYTGPKLKDEPAFAKFFKMIRVKLLLILVLCRFIVI
jgi:hypothetical protein